MERLNGYSLEDGKKLYVGPFQRKSERENEMRRQHEENLKIRSNNLSLYVSNLDTAVDEKFLEAIFSKFGNVTKAHVSIFRYEMPKFLILIRILDYENW